MEQDRSLQTDAGSCPVSSDRSRVVTENSLFIVHGGVFVGAGDQDTIRLVISRDGYGDIIEMPNKKRLLDIL